MSTTPPTEVIRVTVDWTIDDVAHWIVCAQGRNRLRVRLVLVLPVIVLALVGGLLVLGGLMAEEGILVMVMLSLPFFICAAVYVRWQRWYARTSPRRMAKRFIAKSSASVLGRKVIEIGPEFVSSEGEDGGLRTRWHLVHDVKVTDHAAYILLASDVAVILPRHSLKQDPSFQEVVDHIHRCRNAAPPPVNQCPKCRYSLRGRTGPVCPECGWRPEVPDGSVSSQSPAD